MKVTVWMELGENKSAFAIGDYFGENLEYIDLTGGYGSMQIPLKIAYIEDEDAVVCGEEADTFDNAVWAGITPEWTADFIQHCLYKILQQYHGDIVTTLILMNGAGFSAKHCQSVQKKLAEQNSIQIQWISLKQALVGYGYDQGLNDAWLTYFNSTKSMHFHFVKDDLEKEYVDEIIQRPTALEAIDQFYLQTIQAAHRKIYKKEIDLQRIEQTYNDQKMLLYRQVQSKQDVNLYTSIYYPPKKITITYAEFIVFFEQWVQKNTIALNSELTQSIISGGYNQEIFWQKLMDDGRYQYDEHMLFIGAKAFLNYRNTHNGDLCTSTKTHWGYGIIDQDRRRIVFIRPGQIYQKRYVIELILTDYQRSVPFVKYDENMQESHLFNLYIYPKHATTYVTMTLEISIEGQIKEVNYEY